MSRAFVAPTEDKHHPVWTVGFNARLNGNPRRVNQFPTKTNENAHWDYGWGAADEKVNALRRKKRSEDGPHHLRIAPNVGRGDRNPDDANRYGGK